MPRHTDPFALCARRGDRGPLRPGGAAFGGGRGGAAELPGDDRLQRPRPPDRGPLRRATATCSSPSSAGWSSATRASRTRRRKPCSTWPATCTTSGIAACSGWCPIPTTPRTGSSTSSTPTTRRSAARRRAGAIRPRRTSTVARPRPAPPATAASISGRLSRIDLDAAASPVEQVLIEDWCQQYPSHSIGSLEFDAAGNLYATGGDGASFNFADWGQDGISTEPVRGPTRRRRGRADAAHGQGGALRSQDLRTSARPGDARRHGDQDQPGDWRGPAQQPQRLELRPEHTPDHRPGPAQPVPVRDLARQRALGRRRRLGRVGGAQPDADPAGLGGQLRLALLRGGREAGRLRLGQPEHLREPLQRGRDRRPRDRPGAHLQPLRSGGPGRELPERELFGCRGRLLRHRPVPERLRRGAVLRRLLPRLHLGGPQRPGRHAGPGDGDHLRHRCRSTRPSSRSAPTAPSTTRTSTPAR